MLAMIKVQVIRVSFNRVSYSLASASWTVQIELLIWQIHKPPLTRCRLPRLASYRCRYTHTQAHTYRLTVEVGMHVAQTVTNCNKECASDKSITMIKQQQQQQQMTTVAKCNLCDTKIQSLYLLLLLLLLRFVSTAASLHRVSVVVSLFFCIGADS